MCVFLLCVHVAGRSGLAFDPWVGCSCGVGALARACRQGEQVASSRLMAHPVVPSFLQAAVVCVAILQRQSSMVWPASAPRQYEEMVVVCGHLLRLAVDILSQHVRQRPRGRRRYT